MKIFFFSLAYPADLSNHNLYSDLFDEIAERGHEVLVFRPDESRSFGKSKEFFRNKVKIISIPTGKITKTKKFIKAINTLLIERRYKKVVVQYIDPKPDLVVCSTPPITFVNIIKNLKQATGCVTYLLLKDIFPQNAVDLGMIRQDSILHRYFRKKEKILYAISDRIGCMSPANVEYILKHNPEIDASKVHVNPNSIRPTPTADLPCFDNAILERYGIPKDKFRLVYGGNLGEPQGIDFLLDSISALHAIPDVHLTIIGDGTEYRRIKKFIEEKNIKNITLIKILPKKEYKAILACMDVGLIFLDHRFTIPNIPSRILDYLDVGLPVITATDQASDIGKIIYENGAGISCTSDNVKDFISSILVLKNDSDLRSLLSKGARELLVNNYEVKYSADKILK